MLALRFASPSATMQDRPGGTQPAVGQPPGGSRLKRCASRQPHQSHPMPDPILFTRALIVEDLDDPRDWLVEILPQALPGARQVDTAATPCGTPARRCTSATSSAWHPEAHPVPGLRVRHAAPTGRWLTPASAGSDHASCRHSSNSSKPSTVTTPATAAEYPITSRRPWTAGTNSATCRPDPRQVHSPRLVHHRGPHPIGRQPMGCVVRLTAAVTQRYWPRALLAQHQWLISALTLWLSSASDRGVRGMSLMGNEGHCRCGGNK